MTLVWFAHEIKLLSQILYHNKTVIRVQITWIELYNYILYIELELPEFHVREGRIGNLVY